MSQKTKIFTVPSEIDDPFYEDAVGEIPRHFIAGKIINSDGIVGDNSSTNAVPNSSDPQAQTIVTDKQTVDVATKSPDENIPSVDLPSSESTRFGDAFSKLKSSKHFENESTIPVTSTDERTKISGALLVNLKQRGNPLLKNICNVPWEYSEMEPDYVMGKTTCALFLSMRYHNLYPNYVHERLKALGKAFQLRILLVQVDVVEPSQALKDLSVIALLSDCTLMVAWSPEEAGKYLETYKLFENKSADLIKESLFADNSSQIVECLTTVRSINKTDASILMSSFKTLENIMNATSTDLTMCPGLGHLKAIRLHEALHQPLRNDDES